MEKVDLQFIAQRRMESGITLKEMAVSLGFKNASTYLKYEKVSMTSKPIIFRCWRKN